MTTVGIVDGMKYGFKLLGVFIAVSLVCSAFIAGGYVIYQDALAMVNPSTNEYYGRIAAAALIALVGGLGLYGATVGLLYKFIADSVIAGIETAEPEAGAAIGATAAAVGGASDSDAESADEADEGSTEESGTSTASTDADESEQSTTDEDDSETPAEGEQNGDAGGQSDGSAGESQEDEGIFGIDTSQARAEPSEPRTRETPPETTPSATGNADGEPEPTDGQPTEPGDTTAGERPSSPDQRTWERENAGQSPADRPSERTDEESTVDHGYPDSVATNPPREGLSDDESSDGEQGDGSTEELWEGDEGRKNIDQVVSEATEPDATTDGPRTFEDTDTADEKGTLEQDDEPRTIDEAPGEFVAKPPADAESEDDGSSEPADAVSDDPVSEESDESDDDLDPADKLPDEPITDDDIEDTTDEEGDWEPLDESDL
ncbi:hypothetical protein [Halorientalis salina]|uniref:hypothetical protein n=1 Tax=Halorientalis salina TaxID=2932266 RepID=UPI0010ADA0B5|nr:hypothetical protein [Halorientalis salina]